MEDARGACSIIQNLTRRILKRLSCDRYMRRGPQNYNYSSGQNRQRPIQGRAGEKKEINVKATQSSIPMATVPRWHGWMDAMEVVGSWKSESCTHVVMSCSPPPLRSVGTAALSR